MVSTRSSTALPERFLQPAGTDRSKNGFAKGSSRLVRGLLFDPAEYDAAVVEVPDNLVDIPAGGEAHQAWADRWALFVAGEIERRTVRA